MAGLVAGREPQQLVWKFTSCCPEARIEFGATDGAGAIIYFRVITVLDSRWRTHSVCSEPSSGSTPMRSFQGLASDGRPCNESSTGTGAKSGWRVPKEKGHILFHAAVSGTTLYALDTSLLAMSTN